MGLFIKTGVTFEEVIDGIWEGKEFIYNASNNKNPEESGWSNQPLTTFEEVKKFVQDIGNGYFYDIELYQKAQTEFKGLYPNVQVQSVEYDGKFKDLIEFKTWCHEKGIELYDEHYDDKRKVTFRTGEIVNVLNGFDILWKGLQIKGFDKTPSKDRPNAIVYVYDDSYWFPIEIERIFKVG